MKSTFTVRSYHESDMPHLLEICLKTGNDGADGSALFSDPYLLGHIYVMPYLIHSPELCFVVEAEHVPVGYVVATAETRALYKWIEDYYFPPLRKRYPMDMDCASDHERIFLKRLHKDQRQEETDAPFPAHLHINLLPIAQGMGFGRKLIDRLFEALAEQKVPGLYLGTGAKNSGAIAFYKRYGFDVDIQTDSFVQFSKGI